MIETSKIFGRGEQVHIISPEYLTLPKMDLALAEGVIVKSGNFIDSHGVLMTIGSKYDWFGLVMEGSHYNDAATRQKPHKGVEAYFGSMLVDILKTMTDSGGTPFAVKDELSIVDGKLVHASADHIAVAIVVKIDSDSIRYATIK